MQEYINPGTPLKLVKTETFRPDCRPGATFAEADGKYSITLDEKTGCFGKWIFTYDLPAEVTACRFAVRHERKVAFRPVAVRGVEHHVRHEAFHFRAKSTRTGLAGNRSLRERTERLRLQVSAPQQEGDRDE